MRSLSYSAGVPSRPIVPVFTPATRPTMPSLPLGRAQHVVPPLISSDSTSDRAQHSQSSEDVRETKARGSLRGRREETITHTKPSNLLTKLGQSGTKITLTANYFAIERKPDWTLHQYRVDFQPEVHLAGLRKALVRNVVPAGLGYVFDGTVLFTIEKFGGDEPIFQKTARSREEDEYLILFKYTKTLTNMDVASLQVFNLVLRMAMKGLKLQMVGRNYFDPDAKVSQFILF